MRVERGSSSKERSSEGGDDFDTMDPQGLWVCSKQARADKISGATDKVTCETATTALVFRVNGVETYAVCGYSMGRAVGRTEAAVVVVVVGNRREARNAGQLSLQDDDQGWLGR
jgi:hypothetical protein